MNQEDLSIDLQKLNHKHEKYLEVSSQNAYQVLNNKEISTFLLDVSKQSFNANSSKYFHIKLEELSNHLDNLPSYGQLIVFSEDGVRSISACKMLVKSGYQNIIHISGKRDKFLSEQMAA